jgi:protein-S-isoprenylcysteine O-methyltransferase Ste14
MKWKWSNIPLPEAYLVALLAGAALHFIKPLSITRAMRPRQAGGIFNLSAGLLLAAWSVASAGESELSSQAERAHLSGEPLTPPGLLVTRGAYRLSRNPMYLAWTLISSGLSLLVNSLWMLAALPVAFLYIHFVEIPREEASLAEAFDDEYEQYRRNVRRYL